MVPRLWQRGRRHGRRGASALHLALSWTHALVRPFQKPSGGIRPILVSEALVKLAMGATVDAAFCQLQQAMGPHQFGGGRAGGAVLEIEQIRMAVCLSAH